MTAHLRIRSITINDPKMRSGVISIAGAAYSSAADVEAAVKLEPLAFHAHKHEPWTWQFEGDGAGIKDFAEIPEECNWAIVVTHTHDFTQAKALLDAVGKSVTALTGEKATVVSHLSAVLAAGIEGAIDGLFFQPKRLGTFIGSADASELQASWVRNDNRNPQPAAIELGWDVAP